MDVFSLKQLPEAMPLGGTGITVAEAIEAVTNAAVGLGFDDIYRVDILQSTTANRIMNTLYYRFDSVVPFAAMFEGADNCAFQVIQEVVPLLRDVLSKNQLIEAVRVTPYTPLFERKLKVPYEQHVGLYGSRYGVDISKTQRYAAKLRFNLSPHGWTGQIQNLFGLLPSSGRVYIGALGSGDLGVAEVINGASLFNALQSLGNKLADSLYNADPIGNFIPIRIKRLGFDVPEVFQPIVGRKRVNVYTTWSDVDSVTVDTEMTFLKSREL